MRPLLTLALFGLTSLGCKSDYAVTKAPVADEPVLTLEVTSPEYGTFMGDEDIVVTGKVSPIDAELLVEGMPVDVAEDGSFVTSLPVDYAYRIVDIEATLNAQYLRERVPVFLGNDPSETWPGGVTARITPAGFDRLGEQVGLMIDETGWSDQLSALLPGYESDLFDIVPVGVLHEPTVVVLGAADGGIETAVSLRDVKIQYDIVVDWAGYTDEMYVGFGEIAIGGLLVPELDSDGVIWLSLTDARLDLDDADVKFGILEGWLIELVMDGINGWVIEPLGEMLLTFVLDQFGTLELGGPFAFEFDLMGTPLEARLSSIVAEIAGLGAELGLGLGEPASLEPLGIAVPGPDTPYFDDAHVAIGLHEGVIQTLMGDVLLGYLSQELDLAGSFGDILGSGIRTLPGGDEIPSDVDGWCLDLKPGTAYAARLQEGISPLGVVYLPDLQVDIGFAVDGESCETWLDASLAVEVGLVVEDGTTIGIDLGVREGAIIAYGAEEYDEAEMVAALGSWLEGMLSLLGGALSIDLADLAGAGGDLGTAGDLLGDLQLSIVGSAPLLNEDGEWLEGLYAVSLRLWE